MFNQRAAFFHDARFLFYPLFVAIDDHFMFPALDLFNMLFYTYAHFKHKKGRKERL